MSRHAPTIPSAISEYDAQYPGTVRGQRNRPALGARPRSWPRRKQGRPLILRRAGDRKHRMTQNGQSRHQSRVIERLKHGVRAHGHEQAGNRGAGPKPCAGPRRRACRLMRKLCSQSLQRTPNAVVVHHGNNARNGFGSRCGRMRFAASIKPWRASQTSNSGAGRRPNRSRMASAS